MEVVFQDHHCCHVRKTICYIRVQIADGIVFQYRFGRSNMCQTPKVKKRMSSTSGKG
jgi:hypothetical protein